MRFNDCSWQKRKLCDFAKKITTKNKGNTVTNVICNSAQGGLIKQTDFFDKSIANNENTDGYYIININDFVYNPRKSISAPYGPVNMYEYNEKGIVSPLYLCFKVQNINFKFLLNRFKSACWHRYIYLNGDSGARHDRVSIKDDIFLNQELMVPPILEQIKIAAFFDLINKRIETQNKIISALESQKKAICNQIRTIESNTIDASIIFEFMDKTNHQSSDGNDSGNYIFFTNEETTNKFLDIFDFDGEYIIANTGGKANFKYFNGKFATMSDCLVIKTKFAKFYYYYLQSIKDYVDYIGFEGSGLKHLNKKWLLKLQIPSLNEKHKHIVETLDLLDCKLAKEKLILQKYKEQKKFLLSNMFI